MADIFISYDTEDRPKAQLVSEKLSALGYSVWWDRNIIIGSDFWDIIEAELESSRAVIVLWSKQSVKSQWVKAEANRGTKDGRLVPALIESCQIPLRFEILQTADLCSWRGGAENEEWTKVLHKVRLLVPNPAGRTLGRTAAPTVQSNAAAAIPRLANRLAEVLGDPANATPNRLIGVMREFPEFLDAQSTDELWFGRKTKEGLLQHLCEIDKRLVMGRNTGGAPYLKLAQAPATVGDVDAHAPVSTPAQAVLPVAASSEEVNTVARFCVDLTASSTLPIPLAHVANAIEAEFGESVRRSGWLGRKTLKKLLVEVVSSAGLQVSPGTGYLYDPARHPTPLA